MLKSIEKVGIVGAGIMGRGICQLAAQGGCAVLIYDMQPGAAEAAQDFVVAMLNRAAEKGRISVAQADAATARISPIADMSLFSDCDLVIEAIVERLEPKQTLLAELETIVKQDSLIATNTSSLSVSSIAEKCQYPQRVAGLHFFNPVPLMRLVEVVATPRTLPTAVDTLAKLVERFGHRPVRAKDFPGFLVNHAGRALVTEGLHIIEEGVCEPAVLDRVMREVLGFKMGPCELLDLTGLDVSVPAMEEIFSRFYNEPRLRPPALGRVRLEGGLLGRKVGRGFYQYNSAGEREPLKYANTSSFIRARKLPLVAIAADGDARNSLGEWLEKRGAQLVPSSDADLILVAPIGSDVTAEIVSRSLDPSRVVGIDVLFGLTSHTSVCVTPATSDKAKQAALALAQAKGNKASLIGDSVGLLCQRVLAMIVNVGCEIAQKGIGTPKDIDDSVRLGLGYPKGPLEWGDAIGAKTVLNLLQALLDSTGDPRYRPSAWLRRRALLGVPLTQVDK